MEMMKYISYYVYDFKAEAICVAEGPDHDAAQELYVQMTKDRFTGDDDWWAFDIALDCVRTMAENDIELIKTEGAIPFYHFGYGAGVRNKYVYPSTLHTYLMADNVSSNVEDFIYAIIK